MTRLARWAGIVAGVALLTGWSIVRMTRPPAAQPATIADTAFSAGRALRDVAAIAQRPHPIGSADHDRVRDYVIGRLQQLGLTPIIQNDTGHGTRHKRSGPVTNIAALIPGRSSDSLFVMLVAHYDGVPTGPAAADDGSGVAILLETARAIKAGPPLSQSVLLLFTDGEEVGLLGAAAFVRDNALARRVAMIVNFEARGTSGRSYMFETGPGNMDAIRVLATVPDVSAASTFTAVYKSLPNDTDLSEFAALGKPALNFAFANEVRNYHSPRDDMAHLDPRSVQHQGDMALTLARRFASGPLPRQVTGDAVFFGFPGLGLVVYPESWALPLAIVALLFVVCMAVFGPGRPAEKARGFGIAELATLAGTLVAAVIGLGASKLFGAIHSALPHSLNPAWSGLHTGILALLSLAIASAMFALGSAPKTLCGGRAGVIGFWALLSIVVSALLPGASYLFTWPVLVTAAAMMIPASPGLPRAVARWIAAAVTLLFLAGFIYSGAAIMLGNFGVGAIAAGVLAFFGWTLLMPLLAADRREHWRIASVALGCAVALFVVGAVLPAH